MLDQPSFPPEDSDSVGTSNSAYVEPDAAYCMYASGVAGLATDVTPPAPSWTVPV
jgi:hypothetical protein